MVVLLDSTLREGELFSPFPLDIKLKIARLLTNMGVRRAEVTVDYPPRTTREGVEPLVRALSDDGVEVIMHGRAYVQDVEAMCKYDLYGIAVYIATSQLHLEHKLRGMSLAEAIDRLIEAVEIATQHGYKYIRATLEDASRLYVKRDYEELEEVIQSITSLKEAGATIVSLPDTAGLMTPSEAREFFKYAVERSKLPLACHFHNDYGYASANTVEAVIAGAEEAHVCMLGIGDRNGIADLYEVVAALEDIHGIDTGIIRDRVASCYKEFSKITGIKIPWRHPLSEEAKTVRAGVHQSMTIKKPEGYVPEGKLKNDFESLRYAANPYLSHKLVLEIARANGLEITEAKAREVVERIASLHHSKGRPPTPAEIVRVLRECVGAELSEGSVRAFFGEERAYVLMKIRPQFQVSKAAKEILSWEDVDSVDEVYGDMDLIIKGRIVAGRDNFIDRIRQSLGEHIEEMKVLITD